MCDGWDFFIPTGTTFCCLVCVKLLHKKSQHSPPLDVKWHLSFAGISVTETTLSIPPPHLTVFSCTIVDTLIVCLPLSGEAKTSSDPFSRPASAAAISRRRLRHSTSRPISGKFTHTYFWAHEWTPPSTSYARVCAPFYGSCKGVTSKVCDSAATEKYRTFTAYTRNGGTVSITVARTFIALTMNLMHVKLWVRGCWVFWGDRLARGIWLTCYRHCRLVSHTNPDFAVYIDLTKTQLMSRVTELKAVPCADCKYMDKTYVWA